MIAGVWLRLNDEAPVFLGAGELVGRNPVAGLMVDDASVSEAHALVSLRGGRFVLLGLRGVFTVDGGTTPVRRIELRPGQVIHLSRHAKLRVDDVRLPDTVLWLVGPGGRAEQLASAGTLVTADDGTIRYTARYRSRGLV